MSQTDIIFRELVDKQIKNIPTNKKLQLRDIKRISQRLTSSIFDENKCTLWSGYITNTNNTSKGMYVNFYFRKKKVALHRLLYSNFIGELHDDEYLKFNCENRGKCCNIHHMNKFKYTNNDEENIDQDIKEYNDVNIEENNNKQVKQKQTKHIDKYNDKHINKQIIKQMDDKNSDDDFTIIFD